MKKPSLGQNFRFGFFHVPASDRMKAIRQAGFDEVMLWWGKAYQSTEGSPKDLFKLAQKENLAVRTVHYPTFDTPSLWQDGEAVENYLQNLKNI